MHVELRNRLHSSLVSAPVEEGRRKKEWWEGMKEKRIKSQAGWMEVVARQQAARQGRWLVRPVKSLSFARPARVVQPGQPGGLKLRLKITPKSLTWQP